MPSREWVALMEKGPRNWTVGDVGMWLEFIQLSDFKTIFIENCISGEELIELQEEDLVTLGMRTLGHRKRAMKNIQQLRQNEDTGSFFREVEPDNRSETSESDSASLHSASTGVSSQTFTYSEGDRIKVKLYYKDNVSMLSVRPVRITLRDLKRKARKEFKIRVNLYVKDSDGDEILLKRTKDLTTVFRHTAPPIKIYCKTAETGRTKASSSAVGDNSILDSLLDPTIQIDHQGSILIFNKAAENLFGYSRNEVLGRNVKILMPDAYANQHDRFIADYLRTGNAKVIGKTRTVIARTSAGKPASIELSVTESKQGGNPVFTGTIRPVKSSSDNSNRFQVLDSLLEMAVVINDRGNILFMNKPACNFFGYDPQEIIGHGVKELMPSPYKENHDFYMNNYKVSGVKKVIDKARDVLAEKKDGSIVNVNLCVSEQDGDDGKIFTGIIRERKEQMRQSVLAQQRQVLHNLLVPSIIIDSTGMIQGFNKAASKALGYDMTEVLGKNVKMLMDPQHASRHDEYIANYLKTGVAKVIGKERQVFAKSKRGTLTKIRLSVTEFNDGEKKYFTGMLHLV